MSAVPTVRIPVEVVKPKPTPGVLTGAMIIGVLETLAVAWLLMLIAGTVTDWGLSYWHTLLALVAFRLAHFNSKGRRS